MEDYVQKTGKIKDLGHFRNEVPSRENEGTEILCPVCGKLLHEVNLPDMRSIIEDSLYHVDGVRIVNSQIQLYCDFEHRFEKEEVTLDEPHDLTGLVKVAFDGLGNCIQFNLVEVYPRK